MSVYPTFANGTIAQYPYQESDEWIVAAADVPAGFSYTRPQHQYVLRRWKISYPVMVSVDRITLEAFWNLMRGSWDSFTFVDDQGHSWINCRFDMPSLSFQYIDAAHYSVEVMLSADF